MGIGGVMKKYLVVIFLIIFLCIGCNKGTSGKERTAEELLNQYVTAYMNADSDKMKEVFPEFYVDNNYRYLTRDYLNNTLEAMKNECGTDFKLTYTLNDKYELNTKRLESLNNRINSKYNTSITANHCYSLDGTKTWAGSKKTETTPLFAYYCSFSGSWYLLFE